MQQLAVNSISQKEFLSGLVFWGVLQLDMVHNMVTFFFFLLLLLFVVCCLLFVVCCLLASLTMFFLIFSRSLTTPRFGVTEVEEGLRAWHKLRQVGSVPLGSRFCKLVVMV